MEKETVVRIGESNCTFAVYRPHCILLFKLRPMLKENSFHCSAWKEMEGALVLLCLRTSIQLMGLVTPITGCALVSFEPVLSNESNGYMASSPPFSSSTLVRRPYFIIIICRSLVSNPLIDLLGNSS